jgi:AcrR family transcriptional regulator
MWSRSEKSLDFYITVRYIDSMDNKANILANALALFAMRGFDAVGVQEIAERSGITKPTLYYYFGSKNGLYEALLESKYSELVVTLTTPFVYRHDLTKNLTDLAYRLFAFVEENPDFYRMILAQYFAQPDNHANMMVRRYNDKIAAMAEVLFIGAGRDHGNMKNHEKELAATYIGILNTYAGLYLNGYAKLGDATIYQMVRHFMYGIFS